MFPRTMAMMMLEKGSPKKSYPSAKSAMVRFAPNQGEGVEGAAVSLFVLDVLYP